MMPMMPMTAMMAMAMERPLGGALVIVVIVVGAEDVVVMMLFTSATTTAESMKRAVHGAVALALRQADVMRDAEAGSDVGLLTGHSSSSPRPNHTTITVDSSPMTPLTPIDPRRSSRLFRGR